MDNGGKLLLTEREAVQRLSIGRSTLRKLMACGEIRPVHIGRAIRFMESDLSSYVERLREQQGLNAGG